ncbi:MAG: hypothetical protein ACTHOE_01410, partial [Conexibacter sp.]
GARDHPHARGCPGAVAPPAVVGGAEGAAAAPATAGKGLGAVAGDTAAVRTWLGRGARYLLTTVESLVTPGVKRFLAEASG